MVTGITPFILAPADANSHVISLQALKGVNGWRAYCIQKIPRLGKFPENIPANPQRTYKEEGWAGWGDWLGTGNVAFFLRKYRPFTKARAFVHKLGLKNRAEWQAYCKGEMQELGKLPTDISASPEKTYKDKGWAGVGDWLGTGAIANFLRKYRTFRSARSFVRKLGLKSSAEWKAYALGQMPQLGELPADIPAKPNGTYKNKGWAGMGDWLGTGAIATHLRRYRPFRKARAFVRELGLKSGGEWRDYSKGKITKLGTLPADIPSKPDNTYKGEGWAGMGDWLGTGAIATFRRLYRRFNKARAFVHKLGLKSKTEWQAYCKGQMLHLGKLPKDIPAAPMRSYKNKGWAGWGDWVGTGTIAGHLRLYRPFKKARTYVRKLGLKNQAEWQAYCKGQMPQLGARPPDIPTNPNETYKDKGWVNLGDWLGTGTIAPSLRKYRSFTKARAFVHKLGLKNQAEWKAYCKGEMPRLKKLPADIPSTPNRTYKDKGWAGLGDWLGTGTIATILRVYRPFPNARAFAHKLGLKNQAEWQSFCKGKMLQMGKLPADIPACPNQTYKDKGWISMSDWLGTGSKSRHPRSPRRKP